MNKPHPRSQVTRRTVLSLGVAGLVAFLSPGAEAVVSFLGVAAGDASSTSVTLWTRAVDDADPANTSLMLEITTDQAFAKQIEQLPGACTTDSTKDYACKLEVGDLKPNEVYYYRFVGPANERSIVGRFKTAPTPHAAAPLHFAFSGDNDGLIRPYALASVIPSQELDFYVNLGDVIYETASNLSTSGVHNGAPWLNSPSVTNVVFIATDDHQNRINELTYSPTGQTEDQSGYVKVPGVFSIVAGPLGATGDVSRNGRRLTVTSIGMDSTAQNAGTEYANGPQARVLFSFKIDAAHIDDDKGKGGDE
jgi:hypothetical protein